MTIVWWRMLLSTGRQGTSDCSAARGVPASVDSGETICNTGPELAMMACSPGDVRASALEIRRVWVCPAKAEARPSGGRISMFVSGEDA